MCKKSRGGQEWGKGCTSMCVIRSVRRGAWQPVDESEWLGKVLAKLSHYGGDDDRGRL